MFHKSRTKSVITKFIYTECATCNFSQLKGFSGFMFQAASPRYVLLVFCYCAILKSTTLLAFGKMDEYISRSAFLSAKCSAVAFISFYSCYFRVSFLRGCAVTVRHTNIHIISRLFHNGVGKYIFPHVTVLTYLFRFTCKSVFIYARRVYALF